MANKVSYGSNYLFVKSNIFHEISANTSNWISIYNSSNKKKRFYSEVNKTTITILYQIYKLIVNPVYM